MPGSLAELRANKWPEPVVSWLDMCDIRWEFSTRNRSGHLPMRGPGIEFRCTYRKLKTLQELWGRFRSDQAIWWIEIGANTWSILLEDWG
jgi:hypothetical protein